MRPKRICPQVVAEACLALSWANDIDDQSRLVLEQAHDVIESLMARCIATSKVLEVVEAELNTMKYPLMDNEDPGLGL